MSTRILVSIALGACCLMPLQAQDKLIVGFGGGVSTPLNPTGAYTGISGNFNLAAGYKIDEKNSITGEFLWNGLPTDIFSTHPADAPSGKISLYSLTANFRRQIERIKGSPFGVYGVVGGGWYYRYTQIDKNYTVPPNTGCTPAYYWWGYPCTPEGYVYSETVATRGASAVGLNGGVGFTVRLADSGWRFFTEARYHYAFTNRVPTTFIPVTIGLRFN
ncbi:MAG: outer membrane beta-barrel protein [Candidatus Solibacter sp.]